MDSVFPFEDGFFDAAAFRLKNFASGTPKSDDSQLGRPTSPPVFALLKHIAHFQSRSWPASDSPRPDADAPDCKTKNNAPDSSPPPPPLRSREDTPLRTSHCATGA